MSIQMSVHMSIRMPTHMSTHMSIHMSMVHVWKQGLPVRVAVISGVSLFSSARSIRSIDTAVIVLL